METPIADFVRRYRSDAPVRLHMPGHKGRGPLGCESLDITEVAGADALYEAQGIIARSEANATELFASGQTSYSTGGSSQCIQAMLCLALTQRPAGTAPVVVAARNVHRAFVHAAALLDLKVVWLWPEGAWSSLCSCSVTPEGLERVLRSLPEIPAAVYLTSPDYLGGQADIAAIAAVCRRWGTRLLVDNAHGAYLHFLQRPVHPMDLGADLCCDSAHKTLPVLTGGAYLHLRAGLPDGFYRGAKAAMALFGSTSPSYLTLASLDLCNHYLWEMYSTDLAETLAWLEEVRAALQDAGWQLLDSDPLRLTIAAPVGCSGQFLAQRLREHGVECEYADPEHLVFMITPENTREELGRMVAALGKNQAPAPRIFLPCAVGEPVLTIRQAVLSVRETLPAAESLGRICGAPVVSCPPAIPVAVSGERITEEALALFDHYGVEWVDVVTE